MKDDGSQNKTKTFSPDWLVQGVLTKLGDTFDRITGRGWNPSSSLATSKLIEKLKFLLDAEAKNLGKDGVFVPHSIKLMIQWDKFSTDSEEDIKALEHELHAAAIDHINDRRYHSYAPIKIEIKTDYFTEGVRLLGSFGEFSESEVDEPFVNVTIPNLRRDEIVPDKLTVILNQEEIEQQQNTFRVKYQTLEKSHELEIDFTSKKRIIVGRAKENDIVINDRSVSKIHASLVVSSEKQLMVADTGSTNGTFIGGRRIIYGKAFPVEEGTGIKFGTVEVSFERLGSMEDSSAFGEKRVEKEMAAVGENIRVDSGDGISVNVSEPENVNVGDRKEDEPDMSSGVEKIRPSEARNDFSKAEVGSSDIERDSSDRELSVESEEKQDWEI